MSATIQEYLNAAEPYLERLREFYKNEEFIVSDVVDQENHQYVNLVQEGGGVWGVALVGYTYILEQMGIRFMKMAGTSAGAINTLIHASIGPKEEAKSLKILDLLGRKAFFDFVDGRRVVKWLIRNLITSSGYFKRLLSALVVVLALFLVGIFGLVFHLGVGTYNTWFQVWAVLSGVTGLFFIWGIFWLRKKRKQFYAAEFGINPGREFLKWVGEVLRDRGIVNLKDLENHIRKVPEGKFFMRNDGDPSKLPDLNNPKLENFLVLVTSDITNQMKVEFPRMWNLYWTKPEDVDPACFVRASMSIPVFFEPFIIPNIERAGVFQSWKDYTGVQKLDQVPATARFVDGGIISNFPINVFYNPEIRSPRLPTFGVMLEDEETKPSARYKSFMSYAGAVFNTVRASYDKEFLLKNANFNKTICRIDVSGINWLNFNISEKEKLDLFARGAEAAALFLMNRPTGVGSKGSLLQEIRMTPQPPAPAETPEMVEQEVMEKMARQTVPPPTGKGFNWDAYKEDRELLWDKIEKPKK